MTKRKRGSGTRVLLVVMSVLLVASMILSFVISFLR